MPFKQTSRITLLRHPGVSSVLGGRPPWRPPLCAFTRSVRTAPQSEDAGFFAAEINAHDQ